MDFEKSIRESNRVAIGMGVFSCLAVILLSLVLSAIH